MEFIYDIIDFFGEIFEEVIEFIADDLLEPIIDFITGLFWYMPMVEGEYDGYPWCYSADCSADLFFEAVGKAWL